MIIVVRNLVLLVSELPMFSLKISGFGWKENKIRYSYLICLIVAACIWGIGIISLVIPLYIFFAVLETLGKIFTTPSR